MNNGSNDRPSLPPRRGVFDVVRPGRTPASPTSRPVVNNQRPVQDTSVTVGPPTAPRGLMDSKQQVSITPPAGFTPSPSAAPRPAPAPAPQPHPQPVVVSSTAPLPQNPSAQPAVWQQPVQSQPQTQQHFQQDVGEAAVVGQVAQPGVIQPETLPQHDQQAPVPHQPHHRSVWSEVLAIVAIVLLILVILNILVDADILDLPIPHTNFFDY